MAISDTIFVVKLWYKAATCGSDYDEKALKYSFLKDVLSVLCKTLPHWSVKNKGVSLKDHTKDSESSLKLQEHSACRE